MIYEINFEPDSLFIGNLFEALKNNNKDQRELLFNCYTKLKTKHERIIVLNELARISIQHQNSSLLKEIFYALIIIKSEKDVLDEHNLIKIKQEIMSEDFMLLLASQFDSYQCDLFQVFKNFNLIQLINNEKYLLKQAVSCNNHKFLANLVFELDEWHKEFHDDEYLIKESCKHLECFKIFYFSKPTACFLKHNDILKHCLENKYIKTFEFILTQFNHLSIDENDYLKQLIINNLTWKSESFSSLLHYVIALSSYSADEIIHLFDDYKIINFYISINNDILDLIQNNCDDYMPILKYFLENKLINTNEYKLNSNKIIQNECFTNDLIVKELNLEFEQTTFEMIIKRNDADLMDIYLNQLKDKCYSFDYKYLKLINSVKMIQSVFKYLIKIKFPHLESYLEYFIEIICIDDDDDNQLIYGLIELLNDLNEKKYLKIIISSMGSLKLMILIRNNLDLFKSIKLLNDQNVLHYIAQNLNIMDFIKAARIFNYSLVDINDTEKQTPLDIAFQRFREKEILIYDILNDHYSGKFISVL